MEILGIIAIAGLLYYFVWIRKKYPTYWNVTNGNFNSAAALAASSSRECASCPDVFYIIGN